MKLSAATARAISLYTITKDILRKAGRKSRERKHKICKSNDLDNDGTKEILVGAGVSNATSVYVYEHPENCARAGRSERRTAYTNNTDFTTSGVAYGVFCNNLSAGDLDNDA
jgi:accessory colonization factor AcfC